MYHLNKLAPNQTSVDENLNVDEIPYVLRTMKQEIARAMLEYKDIADMEMFSLVHGYFHRSFESLYSDIKLEHLGQGIWPAGYSKLSYHLQEFGHHARSLKLRNVLCCSETCNLLRKSKLQCLVFDWIRSEEQIRGVCKLLNQNCESLSSIEFSHCMFSSRSIDEICDSLINDSMPLHRIQRFSICLSRFDIFEELNPSRLPRWLHLLLLSGRSLRELKLCDTYICKNVANVVFKTLLSASSGVYVLDLSENNIKGWLYNYRPTFTEIGKSLLSLRVLNIRGNMLDESDAADLSHALLHMPNLEVLDISDNPIKDCGIRKLIPYLSHASKNGSFAELHVEKCKLESYGVVELLNCFKALKRPLKHLSIADNRIASEVLPALGKFLSTSIEILNISGIELRQDGFEALLDSMAEELKLVEIDISHNSGGLSAAMFLSAILSCSPGLVSVKATHTHMPAGSARIISSALKTCKGLKSLDLRGNNNLVAGKTPVLDKLRGTGQLVLLLSPVPTSDQPHDDDP